MSKILRYSLGITDEAELRVPQSFIPIKVAPSRDNPNGAIDLWAISNGYDFTKTRAVIIHIVGTGNPMSNELGIRNYFGTTVHENGLVWHVFIR